MSELKKLIAQSCVTNCM